MLEKRILEWMSFISVKRNGIANEWIRWAGTINGLWQNNGMWKDLSTPRCNDISRWRTNIAALIYKYSPLLQGYADRGLILQRLVIWCPALCTHNCTCYGRTVGMRELRVDQHHTWHFKNIPCLPSDQCDGWTRPEKEEKCLSNICKPVFITSNDPGTTSSPHQCAAQSDITVKS